MNIRTAIVVGASSGIGAGLVTALAARGTRVAAVARRISSLRTLATSCEGSGGGVGDVGNVIVQRKSEDGLLDVPYDVAFAFAFAAFMPKAALHYQ